jgi:hypothetical protein
MHETTQFVRLWAAECCRSINLFSPLYVQVAVHRDNLRINNQQDASSVQNFYFVTKLCIFCAHHQELSAVHVATGMFHAG